MPYSTLLLAFSPIDMEDLRPMQSIAVSVIDTVCVLLAFAFLPLLLQARQNTKGLIPIVFSYLFVPWALLALASLVISVLAVLSARSLRQIDNWGASDLAVWALQFGLFSCQYGEVSALEPGVISKC